MGAVSGVKRCPVEVHLSIQIADIYTQRARESHGESAPERLNDSPGFPNSSEVASLGNKC